MDYLKIESFLTHFGEEDINDLIDEMTNLTKKKLTGFLNEEQVKDLVLELACINKLKMLMVEWKEAVEGGKE